ncbi:hypothetical protein [Haliangium sp.]|uniref:GspE/PulE/PilB domain-containing protein n=1 Tax=Haliangium sp. TaxID=2663208 RepID=UPI003D0EDC7D
MKLGEMLLRDGCLTESQLEQALARQAQEGARLGTLLIEMGVIDADTLTVYLGLELAIPIATGATLERAKRSAVRLLTPAEARHYRCIPLIVQDRQLIAAVDDPHDMESLDELYRITGYRVIPRVAPEIRIFYYLERYYGVTRPPRFAALGNSVRGRAASRSASAHLPAPPLPGLPPRSASPAPQPKSEPIIMLPRAGAIARGGAAGDALTSEAEDLVHTLEADTADSAEPAPRASLEDTRMGRPETIGDGELEGYEPIGRDEAIASLELATRRGDVASALMSFAASCFDVAALCVVRDNMAFGWKAIGPYLDADRIESLLIPLDMPSMFQSAIHKEHLLYEAPFPATLHTYLYRVLRCQPPAAAMVAVISIGQRVVNILYGHRSDDQPLAQRELHELREVTAAASEAYVGLIAASKRSSQTPPQEPRRPAMVIAVDDVG